MKRIITTVVFVLVALAVVAIIIVGVSLGQIVKKGVESYGPELTKTTVTLDAVHLSLLTGSAKVTGLIVGNPSGYNAPHSIAVGTIAVGLDPTTVLANKIVVRSIRLEAPDITFEGGLQGNNLSQILDNVDSTGQSSPTLSTNTAVQPKSEKKYEVDDLVVSGAKVEVILTNPVQRQINLTLPDIHLTDLGKGGEGITAADLTRRTLSAITTATIEEVAKEAMNLDQNAATLKQAGQSAGKQIEKSIGNLLNK